MSRSTHYLFIYQRRFKDKYKVLVKESKEPGGILLKKKKKSGNWIRVRLDV